MISGSLAGSSSVHLKITWQFWGKRTRAIIGPWKFPAASRPCCSRRSQRAGISSQRFMRICVLDQRLSFPDPRLSDSEGLVAVGGDMSVDRLLLAYRSGIFPWTVKPVTWWSPDPRAIFELDNFHMSRSLARILRKNLIRTTIDQAF